ncbi:MAG TPA: nucleoside-diphosphate kinase [Candidatus Nanoarchaeia archaeon]|nr:nucleoside-diphosphate kinase [Candidatus Nanoarchaeia archaeon]
MLERTFVMIKPDGVERGFAGKIISRFEDAGLKISAMKMVWITKDFSKKHYAEHIGKKMYQYLEEFITSGPVVAMVVEGVEAVEVVRKLVGSTIPKVAPPGTIRGDFSHHSAEWVDAKKRAIANLIHASGNKDDAKKEIELWFKKDEIHSYRTVHERHVF